MTVSEIKTVEPNPDLVVRLESLLKDAKTGVLQGIVGVVIFDGISG